MSKTYHRQNVGDREMFWSAWGWATRRDDPMVSFFTELFYDPQRVVLVCGGRKYSDRELVEEVLNAYHDQYGIGKIICGDARGADRLAFLWAYRNKVSYAQYIADWDKHGKAAGPIRNGEMIDSEDIDLVIAFPGGKGTDNMCKQAYQANIRTVHITREAWEQRTKRRG